LSGTLTPIVVRVAEAQTTTRNTTGDALCQAARGACVRKFAWTAAHDTIEAAAGESYSARKAFLS
jgi:hypothetical protein